jgi:hypothetical protein
MKDLYPLVSLLALGLFLGFLQLASMYLYGDTATTNSRPGERRLRNAEVRTFLGRVMQMDGKFVLQDNASQDTYLLDDQEKAKPFGGRNVKVVGFLDPQSKTIHVL